MLGTLNAYLGHPLLQTGIFASSSQIMVILGLHPEIFHFYLGLIIQLITEVVEWFKLGPSSSLGLTWLTIVIQWYHNYHAVNFSNFV